MTYLKNKVLHLRELRRKVILIGIELSLEDITLSGSHALEKLTVKLESTEANMFSLANKLLPNDGTIVPIRKAGTFDLKNGYIPLFKADGSCMDALVLDTGIITDISVLEPEETSEEVTN